MVTQLLEGNIWFFQFEIDFIIWLQHLGEGTFIQTVLFYLNNFFSVFGEELIMVALMGAIYWGINKGKGERIAFILLSTNVINPLIKNIVKRLRPWQSSNGAIELLRDVDGYSFPSGHSSSSSAFYPTIARQFKEKKWKWMTVLAIIIPILVAFSRNYLGAHFITDVVCGLALGVLVLVLAEWLLSITPSKYYVYFGALIIFAAGMFYCNTTDYFTSFGLLAGMIFGVMFEEKLVHFENTKVWWRVILRTAVGAGIYLGLNALIKGIFGSLFVKDSAGDFAFRTIRYTIIAFLIIGIYPMIFKVFDKVFKKWGWIK